MTNPLVKLQSLVKNLSLFTSIPQVKEVRDKAIAISDFFKRQRLGLEAQNAGAEVKLRAERRLGELLAETVHAGNPQFSQAERNGRLPEGISHNQSHRWQLIASVPHTVFERYLRETKQAEEELSSAAVLAIAQEPGRLRQLEESALAGLSPEERRQVLEEDEGQDEPAAGQGSDGRQERLQQIHRLLNRAEKLIGGLGPEGEEPLLFLAQCRKCLEKVAERG